MAVSCEVKNGVGVVTVSGSLTAPVVESFRSQFNGWFETVPQVKRVVVDMGGVRFMDSSGLGALIGLLKRVAERGGELRLARPQSQVRTVLEITLAVNIVPIFPTVEEAVGGQEGAA